MMDQFLAAHYGNVAPTPAGDDQEKIAQANVEMFLKAAQSNGVDLDSMSEEQIAVLWNGTFAKEASEEAGEAAPEGEKAKESEGEPDEDKKEKAKEEHEEKKEAAAKFAEAEFLGKVMAHSMVSELRKIASASGESEEGEAKEAAMPPALAAAMKGKGGKGDDKSKSEKGDKSDKGDKDKGDDKGKGGKMPEAFKAQMKGKKKEGSAFEELAMEAAVKIAAEGGLDADQAAARVATVSTLGLLGESEKVASVEDTDTAVQVRGLEYLEAAGYPVNWGG